jgi:hypothetical protein
MSIIVNLTFTAKCDRSPCTARRTVTRGAEEMNLEQFGRWGSSRLREEGWEFMGGTRCPQCALAENLARGKARAEARARTK